MMAALKVEAPAINETTDDTAVYKHAITDIRSSLTCRICLKLLYEPFTTSCGHTFCYECLNQWFKNGSIKTCPDCRGRVLQQPSQAYAIREMVTVLCRDDRLLPEGEGKEEHRKFKEDVTSLLEEHRKSKAGVFEGIFSRKEFQDARFDESDQVWRCPSCFHELEDQCCTDCNLYYDENGRPTGADNEEMSESDGSLGSFYDDEDIEGPLGLSAEFDRLNHFILGNPLHSHRAREMLQRRLIERATMNMPNSHRNAHDLGQAYDESEFDEDSESDASNLIYDGEEEEEENDSDDAETIDSEGSYVDRNRRTDRSSLSSPLGENAVVLDDDDDGASSLSAGDPFPDPENPAFFSEVEDENSDMEDEHYDDANTYNSERHLDSEEDDDDNDENGEDSDLPPWNDVRSDTARNDESSEDQADESSDDDEDDIVPLGPPRNLKRTRIISDDSDDDVPLGANRAARRRRLKQTVALSDDDDDEDEDNDNNNDNEDKVDDEEEGGIGTTQIQTSGPIPRQTKQPAASSAPLRSTIVLSSDAAEGERRENKEQEEGDDGDDDEDPIFTRRSRLSLNIPHHAARGRIGEGRNRDREALSGHTQRTLASGAQA